MKPYICSLDAGTTSNRCIIWNRNKEIVSSSQKEFTQYFPKPGWVEHDATEIFSNMLGVCVEAMAKAEIKAEEMAAIGITNQRETTVVWDRATGIPVGPAIVWQCRRTADICEELKARGLADAIRQKTGLMVDAYFSATKIKWILDHIEGARKRAEKGELMFGTIDTWLMYKLSGGKIFVTDYSNASRTMLFNIHTLSWDEEICRWLSIPMNMLPKVCSSSEIYGSTDPRLLGGPVLLSGAAGDQQAALFGQCCFEKGEAKNTYGTGCFLLMNTGNTPVVSQNGLVTTIAWGREGKITYALEGSVFMAGAIVQWLRDELGLVRTAAETEELAAKVPDSAGCFVVPAFTGLGAPYWDQEARGIITGLTRGVGRCHIVRACLEAVAFQTADILAVMEQDMGGALTELLVDGGASANNFLMQVQADIIGGPVKRPDCVESTAFGAAALAGLAVGFFKDEEELKNISKRKGLTAFSPSLSPEKRAEMLSGWHRAVKICRFKSE